MVLGRAYSPLMIRQTHGHFDQVFGQGRAVDFALFKVLGSLFKILGCLIIFHLNLGGFRPPRNLQPGAVGHGRQPERAPGLFEYPTGFPAPGGKKLQHSPLGQALPGPGKMVTSSHKEKK